MSASSNGTRHEVNVSTPHQSICRRTPCGRKYGNSTRIAPKASTPTGRFTQNVQRQENSSVIQPPSVGPKIDASPHTPANNPWNFARSAGAKISPMMVNSKPTIIARAQSLQAAEHDELRHPVARDPGEPIQPRRKMPTPARTGTSPPEKTISAHKCRIASRRSEPQSWT